MLQLEVQAKHVAQGRIDSVRELKVAAQQRVDVELLAASGIEIQLKAEKKAIAAASRHTEIAAVAKQAADEKFALETK